ncbi:hypothetical protein [Bartonella sp. CB60]|uniref:hypothetical protein n=1 Tax=Bartonella sp. CB60 TaxID=3113619 RepID=UPI00300DC16E
MIEINKKRDKSFDNIATMCTLLIQVPEKRLKIPSGWIAETVFSCTLKALTRYMLRAYNGFVGCGYVIQYPYGEGITTDLVPCFSAPDIL